MPRLPEPLAAAALLTASLTACGGDSSSATDDAGAQAPTGPWTFADGLGQTVRLEETPVRIAAYGDAGAALWDFGITPVALHRYLFHYMDPAEDPTFEDLGLSETEVIGTRYGEINLEELAAAQPT